MQDDPNDATNEILSSEQDTQSSPEKPALEHISPEAYPDLSTAESPAEPLATLDAPSANPPKLPFFFFKFLSAQ
ncbi:MAG: hypothetical protein ACRDHZ_06285, partial [Ktedonobacteraceae bacterium]